MTKLVLTYTKTRVSFLTDTNFNAYRTVFEDFSDKSISINTTASNVIINECCFYKNSSPESAGAVEFIVKKGSIEQSKVCVISCNTMQYGHYTYCVSDDIGHTIQDSTMSKCGDKFPQGSGVFVLIYGKQTVQYTNFSNSKGANIADLYIIQPSRGNVTFCQMHRSEANYSIETRYTYCEYWYCTISNANIDSYLFGVFNYPRAGSALISDSNFINNTCLGFMANFGKSTMKSARCYFENTNTACINAQLDQTDQQNSINYMKVDIMQCDGIPNYYIRLACTLPKRICYISINMLYIMPFVLLLE